MIDIHCHILNEIDDEVSNENEVIRLLYKAQRLGISQIYASTDNLTFEETKNKIRKINIIASKYNLKVRLCTSFCVKLDSDTFKSLKEQELYKTNNSKYILLELPTDDKIYNLEKSINVLIKEGYVPIISHPEKCKYFHKRYSTFRKLIKGGALIQISISSINGCNGKIAQFLAKLLLKNDMVSFIATDSQDINYTYENFKECINIIRKYTNDLKIYTILNVNPQFINEDTMRRILEKRYA